MASSSRKCLQCVASGRRMTEPGQRGWGSYEGWDSGERAAECSDNHMLNSRVGLRSSSFR